MFHSPHRDNSPPFQKGSEVWAPEPAQLEGKFSGRQGGVQDAAENADSLGLEAVRKVSQSGMGCTLQRRPSGLMTPPVR